MSGIDGLCAIGGVMRRCLQVELNLLLVRLIQFGTCGCRWWYTLWEEWVQTCKVVVYLSLL